MRTGMAMALALGLTALTGAALAQEAVTLASAPPLGEVLVTANRASIPYAGQDRPVVGLRRTADSAVMVLYINSDTRDAATRREEIHTVLLAALDRAAAGGFEIVSAGSPFVLVTRQNYKDLPLQPGGRVDTNMLQVQVKTRLTGTAAAAQARLAGFIAGLKGSGRATVGSGGTINLTVINPDQYRSQIVSLVAADARAIAGLFGPDFTYSVTGIDGQVAWAQVSSTEVFLYIPYRYTIVPKR